MPLPVPPKVLLVLLLLLLLLLPRVQPKETTRDRFRSISNHRYWTTIPSHHFLSSKSQTNTHSFPFPASTFYTHFISMHISTNQISKKFFKKFFKSFKCFTSRLRVKYNLLPTILSLNSIQHKHFDRENMAISKIGQLQPTCTCINL